MVKSTRPKLSSVPGLKLISIVSCLMTVSTSVPIIFLLSSLQYTIYNEGDFYNWHTDHHLKPYKNNTVRKLSFTLCLNDEYEGGDFEICDPHPEPDLSTTTTFKFKKGTMIVFPSHIWHRVKPVTKGIRKSLVGWVVGNQWL